VYLKEQGFRACQTDHCVYIKWVDNCFILIVLYVDDLIIASNSIALTADFKKEVSARYKMKDLGELHWCLGMRVLRNRKERKISLDQAKYIGDVLERFSMTDCHPIATPSNAGVRLSKEMSPTTAEGKRAMERYPYKSAVGSLMYAMTGTRPDIANAVSLVSRFMSNPGLQHWQAVKRILRYLKGTRELGITFRGSTTPGEVVTIVAYSDADWGGNIDNRRSTSGSIYLLGQGAVSWFSKGQKSVALSTMEAEYMALNECLKEGIWLRQLLKEMGFPQQHPTIVYEDNDSCIKFTKNPQSHQRSKHIDIRYHFNRETVDRGDFTIVGCPTKDMVADILTKPMCDVAGFKLLRDVAMGVTN
jgi:hypothetical protein